MKRFLLLFMSLIFVLLIVFSGLSETELHTEIPKLLRFTQETVREPVADKIHIIRTYPTTSSPLVDAQIAAAIDNFYEQDRVHLPKHSGRDQHELNIGAEIYISGTKMMGFLVLSQYSAGNELKFVHHDSYLFDMETGEAVTVGDLLDNSKEANDLLQAEVCRQLLDYFPNDEADTNALDTLSSIDALRSLQPQLSAATLRLSFHAGRLYEGRESLMHVIIPYKALSPYMTPLAISQTDNSRYPKVALTFDDGPGKVSKRVLQSLQLHGAKGTFFLVGKNIKPYKYIVLREQNAGHSLQDHSWLHGYKMKTKTILEEKELFRTTLCDIIGLYPKFLRAPGGYQASYSKANVGYPLVHWSIDSEDCKEETTHNRLVVRIGRHPKNGDIVLMHDLTPSLPAALSYALETLTARGFMFLTVDELFLDSGIEPQPNLVYWSTQRYQEPNDFQEKMP